MSNRIGNSVRNIFFGAINRVVSIVFPFIVRTIFIKAIGEEYLGLNTLFSSVLQVLNLADLGFGTAIVASMYKPISDGDTEEICALLNLYRNIYKAIGFGILLVGLPITPFVHHFIKGEPPQNVNIYILWVLYLLNTVVSYLLFAYKNSLVNAHQRNDITEKIGASVRIIISIAQIYVVAVLKSIYLYVFLNIVCSCLYNLWIAYVCNKMYPEYVCRGKLSKEKKMKIVKSVEALAIQKIGNTISLSLDSIIISAYIGLEAVAIYGNYFYVISAVTIFVSLIYTAITASVGNSIVVETVEKNYNDIKKLSFVNSWLIGWCCVCFMCLFQDFMKVWMGDELLFPIVVVLCLVLRFYFEQIRRIVLTYKDAAGLWTYDKWRPLVGCLVNLALNIFLVKKVGVAGVAISTVISYALVEQPWETGTLFKYYFKTKMIDYYKGLLKSLVTFLLVGVVTYMVCLAVPLFGVLAIIVKLMICLVLPNVLFMAINIKNPDLYQSMNLIKNIVQIVIKRRKSV